MLGRRRVPTVSVLWKLAIERAGGEMAISGNPVTMAREIGDGFNPLTLATLKRFMPADLKVINNSLRQVLRDARAETPSPGDNEAVRKKNLRIQRLNQAILILANYCRQHRISV